jgi:RNA polymerase-binding transcription factor DksA
MYMEENNVKFTGKGLAKKLVAVMEACDFVKKNGVNDFHHYNYATSSDVLQKVNTALVKNGLCSVVLPELLEMVNVQNAKGNTEHLATVKVTVRIVDADNGTDYAEFTGIGSGQDAGDKAVMKAQTAALKYAYMLSLNIATGDDPEADTATDNFSHDKGEAKTVKTETKKRTVKAAEHEPEAICVSCGAPISGRVEEYSMSRYGTPLCMDCQRKRKESA